MKRSELELDIRKAYEESPTIEEAEKLAAKFLDARIQFGATNRGLNLDVRMKKAALKGAKAGAYIEAATSGDKKPTEAMCQALVDTNQTVVDAQQAFDEAECDAEEAQNFIEVLKEAHIYYRGLSKGRYE